MRARFDKSRRDSVERRTGIADKPLGRGYFQMARGRLG
jgi:hypothetical protein